MSLTRRRCVASTVEFDGDVQPFINRFCRPGKCGQLIRNVNSSSVVRNSFLCTSSWPFDAMPVFKSIFDRICSIISIANVNSWS